MALQNFQKTVISANLLVSLKKAHVFASLANQSFNGQLNNMGDKVKIIQLSDVAIGTYTRDTDIEPALLDDGGAELVADQGKTFSFKTEDVDAVLQKPEVLRMATDNAAYGLRDAADSYFAGLYAQAGMTSYSTGTTPWDVTSLNVEDVILDAQEKMARVPLENRFMIIPQWFHSKLVLAGLATKQDNNNIFDNGFVGRVFGYDMYLSENVSAATGTPTWDQTRIMAGVKGQSFAFAAAISKIEAYRYPKRFQDVVHGLYVFGGKVLRPDMTLTIYADKTAEA